MLQKYWRMPRALSSVTALAWDRSLAGAIQTLSTPPTGATQLRYLPSGLICTLARSGLPNKASRSISSAAVDARRGSAARLDASSCADAAGAPSASSNAA